jgi:hypothetical protein
MNKGDKRKQQHTKEKMMVLHHISKRNCALLPYLSDESLHTLGEFIFNVRGDFGIVELLTKPRFRSKSCPEL